MIAAGILVVSALLFATTVPASGQGLIGGFEVVDIDEEVRSVAGEIQERLASYAGVSGCELEIVVVKDAMAQLVVGKNFILTIEVSSPCFRDTKTCSNIKVYKPLRSACTSTTDSCLELTDTGGIQCNPSNGGDDGPLVGGFEIVDVNDEEIKGVAGEILDRLASYAGVSGCFLKIVQIQEAMAQLVAGKNYRLAIEVSSECFPDTKICSNIKVYKPLPFACQSRIDSCLELTDTEEIQCTPSIVVDPPIAGGFQDIPVIASKVQEVAKEATQFLYQLIDTSSACPIHLKEVVSAREQAVAGTNYELALVIETDSANFACDYIHKRCDNILVHEPLANCPNGKKNCLIPMDLDKVSCIDVNQIFN